MRIAIDASSVPSQPAGAGVYAIELVRALTACGGTHDGYAVFARNAVFDAIVAGKRNWRVERVPAPSRRSRLFWEQVRLPGALSRLGIDLLHSTHHTLPLRRVRAQRVVTIHDVTFLRMPERYPPARRLYMRTMTRVSARAADAIIVPSQTVRDDVVRLLAVPAGRVTVVYEAAAAQYTPVEAATARAVAGRYGMDGPYVLSVGSLEPGKNRTRLIRAMRALREDSIDARLLIVGQRAWGYEADEVLAREPAMAGAVRFAGFVPAEDMPALYSGATAFAMPSLYEGFGLPVLEAMACGTPVLTSNVSATAEVAGDAALLVDPMSLGAIRDGLRRLLTDNQLRERLHAAGRGRAAQFSWQRAARETRTVYERTLGVESGSA